MFGEGPLGFLALGQPDESASPTPVTPVPVEASFSVELSAEAVFYWDATGSFNMGVE